MDIYCQKNKGIQASAVKKILKMKRPKDAAHLLAFPFSPRARPLSIQAQAGIEIPSMMVADPSVPYATYTQLQPDTVSRF
jgi:hypothetical protein